MKNRWVEVTVPEAVWYCDYQNYHLFVTRVRHMEVAVIKDGVENAIQNT